MLLTLLCCHSSSTWAPSTSLQSTYLQGNYAPKVKLFTFGETIYLQGNFLNMIITKKKTIVTRIICCHENSLNVMVNLSSSMLITSLSSKVVWTWKEIKFQL